MGMRTLTGAKKKWAISELNRLVSFEDVVSIPRQALSRYLFYPLPHPFETRYA